MTGIKKECHYANNDTLHTEQCTHSKEICSVLHALGRNGKIRTCDLYHPKVALYQTELRPENGYM